MTSVHALLFLVSAIISGVLTLLIRRFVLKTGLGLSAVRERDVHTTPVPRLGGVAVTVTFLLVVVVLYWLAPDQLVFVQEKVLGSDKNLIGIIAGVILLLLVGIFDDIFSLSAWKKLVFHFVAGFLLAASGVLIHHITNPFGGEILLGAAAPFLVVLWVVFMINAINWIDGLDGLASGVSLIATIILFLLAIKPEVNQLSMAVLAVILAGSLAGFLPFNFHKAKIFLGDSGSQVLGFLLATFAIISGGKLATAFLILGVPLLDTIWVIARRVLTGKAPYHADRLHIHHRLLKAGLSQREAVTLLYAISAAFGIVALNTESLGKFVAAMILIGIMIVGGLALAFLPKLRGNQK